MPEVGDLSKPKLVFFFDEAHLLFNEMPNDLLKQVIQIVKLIRSKGIGLYFISQNPKEFKHFNHFKLKTPPCLKDAEGLANRLAVL